MQKFKSNNKFVVWLRRIWISEDPMKQLSALTLAGMFAMLALCLTMLTSSVLAEEIEAEIPAYKRSAFRHWVDYDSDCQSARAETLITSSYFGVLLDDKGCRVTDGLWLGPYTGNYFSSASDLDIDHVVPLKAAWDSGADMWDAYKRKQFANDPDNLLAVEASANRRKGAKAPTEWMPPLESYRCEYVLRWLLIKKKYALRIPEAEWATLTWCDRT